MALSATEKLAINMTDERIAMEIDFIAEDILQLIIADKTDMIAERVGALKSWSSMITSRTSRLPEKRFVLCRHYSHTDKRQLWKVETRPQIDRRSCESWMETLKADPKNKKNEYFIAEIAVKEYWPEDEN